MLKIIPMEHIEAVKSLIDTLQLAKDAIQNIQNLPEPYRIKADKTLSLLINSSASAVGLPIDEQQSEVFETKPVTNFLGREITPTVVETHVQVNEDDLSKFREKIQGIIDNLDNISPKQLYDNNEESVIRGVAKVLGLEVTANNPERINLEFIQLIYDANDRRRETETALKETREAKLVEDQKKKDASNLNTEKVVEETPAPQTTSQSDPGEAKKAEQPEAKPQGKK